jgi:pimeloyl-ACP methyl ester carboxylesterase
LDDRPVEVWYPVEPAAVEGQSSEMFDSINAISEVLRPFIPGDLGGEVDTGTYRDAPPATEGGPFPTAAYSHGSPGYRQAATFLTGHLASHGVITIAVEHLGRSLSTLLTPLAGADTPEDDVADLLDALDLVGSDPGLGSVVDTSRMVVIGHSAGARTAALATADDRVVGVVLLAGAPQELATNRPALMVAFENDAVIDPAGIWSLHQSLDNSVFVNIAGTGHAAPIDACPLIQDRGGLTELREALGEAIVRAGEDGCLPKDTDARAVQDLLRIYITGFVYEALGLSEGPVNLTAEAADLVAGVELRGFNEPPTTTTTTTPPTTTKPPPAATFSEEVNGDLSVTCGADGLAVEYRLDGDLIDPETGGLSFTQGAQSFHRVVGAEDGEDTDYLFDGGWWVVERGSTTDGFSCEPYEGPEWEDFTDDSILVTEIIWADTELRDILCPQLLPAPIGVGDCVVDFDYVRRATVDGHLLEIGFDCTEAGVGEAWWVLDSVMVANRYYHPPEFGFEDYEKWLVAPMRDLYGDSVYDYVAHVEWVDGEAFVFDIGRVGIDLSLEAFLGRDNCVLLDWSKTQTSSTTATLQTAVSAPPTLEVLSQHPTVDCMNEAFDKFIDVFGMFVVASPGAPLAYVEHTANVLAEYIDNDADGIPDDQAVLDVLVNGNFVVPVWTESDRVSFWDNARGTYCEDNTGMAASMYYEYDEWALGGIEAAGTWDGNLEEVWHVVSIGWYATYPEYFGDEPGASRLTEAMDTARGGQFLTIPSTYPAGSWYRYYDDTCEYGCQMHEYFYWILMANIDALDPSITDKCEQSQHEWHICNQAELEKVDVLAFDLFNNHGFSLPTNIPTGNYQPFGN